MRTRLCTVALGLLSPVFAKIFPLDDYDIFTTNGKITGHPQPNLRNTAEFLGISYAQPPVGPLRFASPLPPGSNESFVAANRVCSNALSGSRRKKGGDKNKVTLFGQSSGGVAPDWWTFAYKDDPLVTGIIMESGNAFSSPMNSQELQTNNWHNVSATLGCGSSEDTIECVRSKSWQDVLTASARLPAALGGHPIRSTPAFLPTRDNQTVFGDYASLLKRGQLARIVR